MLFDGGGHGGDGDAEVNAVTSHRWISSWPTAFACGRLAVQRAPVELQPIVDWLLLHSHIHSRMPLPPSSWATLACSMQTAKATIAVRRDTLIFLFVTVGLVNGFVVVSPAQRPGQASSHPCGRVCVHVCAPLTADAASGVDLQVERPVVAYVGGSPRVGPRPAVE